MKITFYTYDKGKRTFLWDWPVTDYVPRKDEFVSLEALGYGDSGKGKVTLVQSVLWKDKNNVEITVGM